VFTRVRPSDVRSARLSIQTRPETVATTRPDGELCLSFLVANRTDASGTLQTLKDPDGYELEIRSVQSETTSTAANPTSAAAALK
jgi:hypothetical protein